MHKSDGYRIGTGSMREVHTLFIPASQVDRTVWPPDHGHVSRAASWALDRLGRGDLGGHIVVLAECPGDRLAEALSTALAVDDAISGGFGMSTSSARLRTWLAGAPSRLRAFATAVDLCMCCPHR